MTGPRTSDEHIAGMPSVPPETESAETAAGLDTFLLRGGLVDAYFVRRSRILFVTFDNLASVGEYQPPQPWLHVRIMKAGFSILGLIASRKDWYRNEDTPRLLEKLRDAGFFRGFERVVFTGASMGGYAALTYSRLVPGAVVLAFSPQTTLSRRIAPFEKRFRYAQRKWNWDSPDFLDAADGLSEAREVWLFYDPFVPEDRAHALRIEGDSIRYVKCGHFGHRLIRQLKACGALDEVFRDIGTGTFDRAVFRKLIRARRDVRLWRKELLKNLEHTGHRRLARHMAEWFLNDDPNARFAQKAHLQLGDRPEVPPAESIIVKDGKPKRPFRGEILRLRGAIVVPERDHDTRLASGVLLADRSYCELSRAWIRAGKATPVPSLSDDERIEDLPGRHLFAGHMRRHFGHFLVESTARLWALSELEGKIDSVLYLPYRGGILPTERAISAMAPFFERLGVAIPVRTYDTPVRVEELYVPELGFGWSNRYAGSPLYRRFMRDRLAGGIAAEGGEKLYISRAKLPSRLGAVLGETFIEQNLSRQGYEIFHPEKHPLDVQIARYKAARKIVALDGSALHLAAYLFREGGRVAIILRRSKANSADYVLQYRSFCNVTPDVIDVIRKDWVSGESTRSDYRSVGELDFASLFGQLTTLGYVEADFTPDLPSENEIAALVQEFSERRSEDFRFMGDET